MTMISNSIKSGLLMPFLAFGCADDSGLGADAVNVGSLVEARHVVESSEVRAPELGDALVDEQLVSLDLTVLEHADSDELIGRSVVLSPFDARPLELVITRVERLLPGVQTFGGRVEGDPDSHFVFSVEGETLVGTVHAEGYVWQVEPQADSPLHVIRQLDAELLPRPDDARGDDLDLHGPASPAAELDATSLPPETVASNGEVRVLFLHASNVPNAAAKSTNIVSAFNDSLAISGVSGNNSITMTGVVAVANDFSGQTRASIVLQMGNRSGPFANIDALMDAHFADVAFLLIDEQANVAGETSFGRVGGVAFGSDPARPFGLSTDDYALGDLTALHELGHVFGGRHEDFASGSCRPVVNVGLQWMTVMGGYISCPFTGLPATGCVRLNRWSNPAQTYNGVALGVANQSDMESCLEASMPDASNWGLDLPPIPAAPTPLVRQSEQCYGLYEISWASVAAASEYRLYASTSSTFNSPFLVYGGALTSKLINVSSGTWYLRAQACNISGCSGYTPQVSATRIGGCL